MRIRNLLCGAHSHLTLKKKIFNQAQNKRPKQIENDTEILSRTSKLMRKTTDDLEMNTLTHPPRRNDE